ncbi:MAG: hypothetical protein JW984_09255 [Deltaproteobacteria bacterium]|uniref:Uncharacterized protein n=1 Tax=Candidatus Zymogenus saltonus TaxID=2844893 RepID=A0A9D8KF42_9DELT|nr:hypothetical protein [Candidatus Zymogenus saltonus]
MKEKKHNYITLRGIIVPANWDRDGVIVDLALLTDDEREFFIEKGDVIWNKLLDFLREEVNVTASRGSIKNSRPTIVIKTFEKTVNRKTSTLLFS